MRVIVAGLVLAFAVLVARGEGLGGVPNSAEQAKARGMIRKVFEKEYAKTSAADRRALAVVLLGQGRATNDDAAARYVALSEAVELASGAGDASTALLAVEELSKHYGVEALELRKMALVRANAVTVATGGNATDFEAVVKGALETAEKAAEVDAFEMVASMVNLAEGAANKTKQVRVVAGIQEQVGELKELAAEFERVKGAFGRLEKEPSDGEAELVIGRFYALHKGQWGLGLSHLAAGSDGELAALAAKELGRSAEGVVLAELGDGWWSYGEKATGRTKRVVMAHAREIYGKAQKAIAGITLARIESRMKGGEAAGVQAAASVVDLLGMVDVAKDAAVGKWMRGAEGALVVESGAYGCLRLPFAVPEEYDVRVDFTRVEGKGAVAVLLVEGKRTFGFALDVAGEARFEQVNGKVAKDNPTVVPVAVTNGRRYGLVLEVRKTGVRAVLEGKELVAYKTDYKDMTRYGVWKLGGEGAIGVGANNARVVFEKVEMVEVTGKGRAVR